MELQQEEMCEVVHVVTVNPVWNVSPVYKTRNTEAISVKIITDADTFVLQLGLKQSLKKHIHILRSF